MHPRMLLRALAIIAAVCGLSLFPAAAFAQDLPAPDALAPAAVVKADRDAPFPPPPDALDMAAAAANLPDAPASLDQWSKLALQSFRDGNWEIYLARGDGSAPQNLSKHRGADARPALNLGATRVAFNSERDGNSEIYTINTDGSGLTRLTFSRATDFAPAWSPDGSRIVFVSDRTGNYELFVMNADGSSPLQLTLHDDADTSPVWSPDGQWIAAKRSSGGLSTIYLIRPDGSGLVPLVGGLRYVGDLSWSPDSGRLFTDADIDGDYWNELVVVRYPLWGHWEVETLLDANQPLIDLWAGSYAPDGSAVAFSMVQYVVKGRNLLVGRTDILRAILSSGGLGILAGSGYDLHPSWQTADLLAPTSRIAPLPQFVQAGRVPIRLEGADNGPSGIKTFDVQCALAADGPWTDMATNVKGTEAYLTCGEPGDAVWLRARATDYAGNMEAWATVAPERTQLYLWDIHTRGVDSRGVAVPNSTLTSSPDAFVTRSDDRPGAHQLLYTTEQTYTLGMTAPSYGVAAPTLLQLNADARLDLWLPPATELIQNGGFEDGSNGWMGDGAVVAGGLADGAHSGNQGLALGSKCAPACFSGPHRTGLEHIPSFWTAQIIDKHSNLHVIRFPNRNEDGASYYQMRAFDSGLWSEQEPLPPIPPPATLQDLGVAIDGQGTLYVIIHTYVPDTPIESAYDLLYTQKTPGGAWTPFTSIVDGSGILSWRSPIMIGDSLAGLHVLVEGRYYYRLQAPESWLPMLDIYPGQTMVNLPYGGMAVGDDGVVHFVGVLDNVLTYRKLTAQRTLSELNELAYEERGFDGLGLWVGPHGAAHMAWNRSYRFFNRQGYWTQRQNIAEDVYYSMHLLLDKVGRLHVFGTTVLRTDYFVKTLDGGWSSPQMVDIPQYIWPRNVTLAADGTFQLHYIESTGEEATPSYYAYWSSPIGSTGTITTVSQVVTLPAQMVHPTLSFFHKAMSGDPQGQARLSVQIDDGLGAMQVFSTPAAVTWTQSWVDVEPWLGKTVTVTFAVEQADAEPLLSVYLDDISLGAWTTPVIGEISPAQIGNNWDNAPLTVRGDNFTAGSTLRLGETALAAAFIDEHTLQATIPAGLAAGGYDLWVQNPGGQQNVAPSGFTLGRWSYLPAIRK